LTNRRGITPEYIREKYDNNAVGGKIFTFADADIDVARLDEPSISRGLNDIFKGLVNSDPGEIFGKMHFYVMPSKKSKCVPLTVENSWLARNIIHLGIFGATGQGKTVCLGYILFLYCNLAETENVDMEIHLLDQKLTFAQKLGIADSSSFTCGLAVLDKLEELVAEFEQIKLNPDRKIRIVCIDEFISFVDKLSSKQRERARSLVGTLVFESREYNYHVILAGQSSHSERFGSGVRDSLTSRMLLGRASVQEKHMLFPEDVGLLYARNSVGQGYMRIEGRPNAERFSLVDAVPDFDEIGAKVRKHMK
jgi:hypothetical protein